MKIKADLEAIIQKQKLIDTNSAIRTKNTPGNITKSYTGRSAATLRNTSHAKALIDAMAINQMAKDLMHKAMQISTRLMNIAMDAVTSGRVKGTELTDAITATRNSLSRMQESFVPAIVGDQSIDLEKINVTLPNLDNEIKSMKNIEALYTSQGKIDTREINNLVNSIKNRNSTFEDTANTIREALGIKKSQEKDIEKLTIETERQMAKNPGKAITAQGNISPEVANSLII